jgi:acyl-CoA synthetase (NDP forming)
MKINFVKIEKIFGEAEKDGRNFLLEYEVYQVLEAAGIQTPSFHFIKKGERAKEKDLAQLGTEYVVLKIVAPLIIHKTDVGGVQFVKNEAGSVNDACQRMLVAVPRKFQTWLKQFQKSEKSGGAKDISLEEIEGNIRGILVCEHVAYDKVGFGSELLLGLQNSREFGPVITMGAGGVDVEYLSERLKERKAASISSAHLLEEQDILSVLEPLAVYDKLVLGFRGQEPMLPKGELVDTFFRFQQLGAYFSPFDVSHTYVIEEAEVNPFVCRDKKLVPLDGMCRFSRSHQDTNKRPFENIIFLLKPQSIGIIGVSEKMNLGHIILINILKQGFPKEKVFVVKPGLKEIEGCVCVPTIADLPRTVDLFVFTLAAEQSYEVMKELVDYGKARSVIIVAAGLGEKKGTQDLEQKIKDLIAESKKEGKLTPLVNGGNCLGIISKPGKYDTTFVPETKLAWPASSRKANLVYVSQSGAFMISRMSKIPAIEPLYGVSLGNQIDLRISDYLNYLKDDPEAKVFAVYVEGFQPGDGFALAKAAQEISCQEGKTVVIYKSGRTPEGKAATSSHTASVAGDYNVCRAILEQAGVLVADSLFEFENSIIALTFLADKIIKGNRVGLISNAGFESVIMADSLKNDEELKLASFSAETQNKILEALSPLGIDQLQDIKNPLDVTPVANDAVFCECARAMLEDESVDCAVISPVPMTPAMQTLAPGKNHHEDIYKAGSTVMRLIDLFQKTDKPFVMNIDAGAIYDPMVDLLHQAGVLTFRRVDEAVKFLRKYITHRLKFKQ